VKLLQYALAAGAVSLSLCACSAAPTPTAPSAIVTADASAAADASPISGDFDSDFYRAFVQNGYESPNQLEPVRLLQAPLHIYVRTEDDAGRAIDAATLDSTEHALLDTARIWSGDTFGIVEVMRGKNTKEKVSGWLTVKWASAASTGRCGRSTIGVDGGFIELNSSGECSCGMTTRVYPRVVRHELGHAMGYYHTDNSHDVMYGRPITPDACNVQPSDRERLHAKIAHSRPTE